MQMLRRVGATALLTLAALAAGFSPTPVSTVTEAAAACALEPGIYLIYDQNDELIGAFAVRDDCSIVGSVE